MEKVRTQLETTGTTAGKSYALYSGGNVKLSDISMDPKEYQMCVVLALETISVNCNFIHNCDLILIAP